MVIPVRYRTEVAIGKRLTPAMWSAAALAVIAEHGVERLSVEGLATLLGATKGSFYWHFADRNALVESAATLWEQRATRDVIDELSWISDPRIRLRHLLEVSFTDSEHGPIDSAMAARSNDPVVGGTVRRVTATRTSFIESIFADLGFDPIQAARRARVAYAAYLGHFPLLAALPHDPTLAKDRVGYLDQLVELLLAR